MKKLIIFGIPIGVIIAVSISLYLAYSDFQSSMEIIDEGQEVIESAEERDAKEFTDRFTDWLVNTVLPILIAGAFISVFLMIIFGKKK